MDKISLILPTRQRPDRMERLWSSVKNTIKSQDYIELCFYIDEDDELSINKIKEMCQDKRIKYMIGPRIVLSDTWNKAYENLATGDIIMLCADDIVFRTKNWDEYIRNEFLKYEDKILYVYTKDGYADELWGTHPFVSRKWIELVGYFLPPYFPCDFVDSWLNNLASKINRRVYLPNVYTEHMHPVVGKSEKDETFLEKEKYLKKMNLQKIYNEKENERLKQANNLIKYIEDFYKNKNYNLLGNEYEFYSQLDSFGGDFKLVKNKSVFELKKICEDNNLDGFNTYGYLKTKIDKLTKINYIFDALPNKTLGIYIRKK